ncbi:MAG TPA: FtsX-like permease family protein, partial [Terriglobales bacterium]|nr:FtsX-like permease family protein [Terriglobales bacterium]
RSFNDHDTSQSPKVIIVNSALARHYWPNENPIGKHIAIGRREPAEVIGLAGDVRNSGIASDARPQIYLPFTQLPWADMNLLVRTAGDPHQFVSAIRQQVYAVDPDQPVTGVQTLDELLDGSRAQPRFTAFLLGMLSALAILLAIAGIYGAILYMVAQRRPEIGIRIALGAGREDILKLVMSSGIVLSAIGIGIGLVAALATTRFLSSLLYQVKTHDVTSFLIAPLAFLLISALATYLPARQATEVDPSELLRN